jgi:sugar phosphate isomerase/epimerase
MHLRTNRRRFLVTAGTLAAGLGVLRTGAAAPTRLAAGVPHAEKLGWRLGCLFNCFDPPVLEEAVAQTAALGLHYFEAGSRPAVFHNTPKAHLDPTITPELRRAFQERLRAAGLRLVSYYTYQVKADAAAWRREFAFAKSLGVEILVAEPEPPAFDAIERLCDEFQISLAVHNHPPKSFYWNLETVLEVCRGRSRRIGVCADTGHWMRAGIRPLEAVKRLEDRLIEFHLKDRDAYGMQHTHQVAWGAGRGELDRVLQEVKRQDARPLFIMEHEEHGPTSMADIVRCVEWFDGQCAMLLGKAS